MPHVQPLVEDASITHRERLHCRAIQITSPGGSRIQGWARAPGPVASGGPAKTMTSACFLSRAVPGRIRRFEHASNPGTRTATTEPAALRERSTAMIVPTPAAPARARPAPFHRKSSAC